METSDQLLDMEIDIPVNKIEKPKGSKNKSLRKIAKHPVLKKMKEDDSVTFNVVEIEGMWYIKCLFYMIVPVFLFFLWVTGYMAYLWIGDLMK